MPRKHRRVHHPQTKCRCPEGSKRVERCVKKGDTSRCHQGRNFGCIAMVLPPGGKKPMPRFVKMLCEPEAGKVEQWKPPKGYKRVRKKGQLPLRFNKPSVPPEDPQRLIDFNRNYEQMRLFNNRKKTPVPPASKSDRPWWWRE